MKVYYMILKYILLSHKKLSTALIVDTTKIASMTVEYTDRAYNLIMSSITEKNCSELVFSIGDIAYHTQKLLKPLPQLKSYIWQGINKYTLLLYK